MRRATFLYWTVFYRFCRDIRFCLPKAWVGSGYFSAREFRHTYGVLRVRGVAIDPTAFFGDLVPIEKCVPCAVLVFGKTDIPVFVSAASLVQILFNLADESSYFVASGSLFIAKALQAFSELAAVYEICDPVGRTHQNDPDWNSYQCERMAKTCNEAYCRSHA